MVNLMDQRD